MANLRGLNRKKGCVRERGAAVRGLLGLAPSSRPGQAVAPLYEILIFFLSRCASVSADLPDPALTLPFRSGHPGQSLFFCHHSNHFSF